MRKLLIIFIFLSFYITASAANLNEYFINELNLSVGIPSELTVFQRGILNDDDLKKNNMTREDTESLFLEKSIFLKALNEDSSVEVLIQSIENDQTKQIKDYESYTNEDLYGSYVEIASMFHDGDVDAFGFEIYAGDNAIFYKHQCFTQDLHSICFSTVINSKAYNFSLNSFSGEITQQNEDYLKSIIDSANFSAKKAVNNQGGQSEYSVGFSVFKDFNSIYHAIFIFLCVIIFLLPIGIYRNSILKRPLPFIKSLTITIAYGIIMGAIISTAYYFSFNEVSTFYIWLALVLLSILNCYVLYYDYKGFEIISQYFNIYVEEDTWKCPICNNTNIIDFPCGKCGLKPTFIKKKEK